MKRIAAALALFLPIAGAQAVELPPGSTPERLGSVMIEWTIANCPGAPIPAISAMQASMILNGSPPEIIGPIRDFMREGAKANYPDEAAACADMIARIPS